MSVREGGAGIEALRLEGLVAGEGAFRIGPVSLEVAPGRSLAIVGPNGAGKSSLLRVLAGLRRPQAGRRYSPGPAAWLPPPGSVQSGLEVLTMVTLGRAARRPWAPALSAADRAAALEALFRLGIEGLADRSFDTLSSGQQQLVLMARLTVQDAAVCLVDEPTALLDPAHSARVVGALFDLAAPSARAPAGRIVIFATHDLSLAARADRLLLLARPPVELDPREGLSPGRLEAVFGSSVAVCPCCGQPTPTTRDGRPGDTIGSRG